MVILIMFGYMYGTCIFFPNLLRSGADKLAFASSQPSRDSRIIIIVIIAICSINSTSSIGIGIGISIIISIGVGIGGALVLA